MVLKVVPTRYPKIFYYQILIVSAVLVLASCNFLTIFTPDADYQEMAQRFHNIQRVAVFVQRWPHYLRLTNQAFLGEEYIKTSTLFYGPFQTAENPHPRAIDVADVDDHLVAEILVRELAKKGFQPEVAALPPLPQRGVTIAEIMARYQLINPEIQSFLFCFFSPTLFVAHPQKAPQERLQRPFRLLEIVNLLNPGQTWVIWAGPHAGEAPPNAISHAYIYWSMTLFRAWQWQPLVLVADSQVATTPRLHLPQCPPAPTKENYPADTEVITRLMLDNLRCRLRFLLPDAF